MSNKQIDRISKEKINKFPFWKRFTKGIRISFCLLGGVSVVTTVLLSAIACDNKTVITKTATITGTGLDLIKGVTLTKQSDGSYKGKIEIATGKSKEDIKEIIIMVGSKTLTKNKDYSLDENTGSLSFNAGVINDSDNVVIEINKNIPITKYSVNLNVDPVGAGTVIGEGEYAAGESISVTATPNSGYNFVGWYEFDKKIDDAGSTYTFAVTSSRTLTAKFEEKDYSKYTVSCMGDSITYGTNPNKSGQLPNPYPSLLKTTFGFKECINYGIPGSTVANGTNSYKPMVDRIKTINPSSNVIIFYGGGNDRARGLPKGKESDKDTTSLYGAFYNICAYLKENFKDAFIMFMTPLPAKVGGIMYHLTNVIEPMEYTCKLFDIPVLDLTYNSGFEEEIEAGKNDNIHPTQEYVTSTLTPKIANFLKEYL